MRAPPCPIHVIELFEIDGVLYARSVARVFRFTGGEVTK